MGYTKTHRLYVAHSLGPQTPGFEGCFIRIRSQETLTRPHECYNSSFNHITGIVHSTESKNLDGEEANGEAKPYDTTSNSLATSFSEYK